MVPVYAVDLELENIDGTIENVCFQVTKLANARFTARDRVGMRQLLEQWEREGHQRLPKENPSVCFSSRYLLTTGDAIEVQGSITSGEVEFVVFQGADELYVGMGSDHCDRS